MLRGLSCVIGCVAALAAGADTAAGAVRHVAPGGADRGACKSACRSLSFAYRQSHAGDVIRLTRGSLALVPCASRLAYEPCKNCVTQEQCRLRWVMLQVRDEMARVLDTIRLSDPVPVPLENVAAE